MPSDLRHPIDLDGLPFRAEPALARLLGAQSGQLEFCLDASSDLPRFRCVLPRPVVASASVSFRVHSRAGIPLGTATAILAPGDRECVTTPVAMLAMESYKHLSARARRAVEQRVWSRRAFAVGSAA